MDDQDPPVTTSELSNAHLLVRIVLESCTASLSVIGSTCIVFKILRDRVRNGSTSPYDRFLLGLSSCDIIASITWVMVNFLKPRETGDLLAFGNAATCQASGFLTQFAVSSWWYNCVLSYYFLLTVLSQVHRKNFVELFEPWMHLSVLFFPITASVGLGREWYSLQELIGVCYIEDPAIKWIVGGIPILLTYFSLIWNNMVIYVVVRKSLQSSSEYAASLTPIQKRLQREATTIMFLYVACFFLSISPSLVLNFMEVYNSDVINDASRIYPLKIFESILLPLQGFFNFFIYIKPLYTRFRAANPNKSMRFVLKEALFNPNIPHLNVSRSHPTSNAAAEEGNTANLNRALFNSIYLSDSDSSSASNSYPGGLLDLIADEDTKEEK